MKSIKSVFFLILLLLFSACAQQFGRLRKSRPRVSLALPLQRNPYKLPVASRDSVGGVKLQEKPNFIFVRANGDSVPVGVSAEWDSISKENITTVMTDEVVITAASVRNTAERNGKINVEFVVTVPKELQRENWMLNVRPVMLKGDEADSLRELRFSGPEFRATQERQYRKYDRFLQSIIPDSVNFYHTFVDYRSFERYLDRLQWEKRNLERRWSVLEAKRRRPDPLLLRFARFNAGVLLRDSLLKDKLHADAMEMITRRWWRYDRALAAMNDTLSYLNKYLLSRFRYFNRKGILADDHLSGRYRDKLVRGDSALLADSASARSRYFRDVDRNTARARELIGRKAYFHSLALESSLRDPSRPARVGGADPELYYDRFAFFNEKMEKLRGRLYMHFRVKGARREGDEGVKMLRAYMAGKDTTSSYLTRSQLAVKYTKRYERIMKLFPMYHFRRPEQSDSLSAASFLAAVTGRLDTVPTRRFRLSRYSEQAIYDHYSGFLRADTLLGDSTALHRRYASRENFFRSLFPIYTFRRTLPDSVRFRAPGKKTIREFEASRFDSAGVIARYEQRYEHLKSANPRYRLQRPLVNRRPPAVLYARKQQQINTKLDRLNTLDSAGLVKVFYNTQKIARNEARKAMRDEKFRDIVRFPYNSEARLDTIIYAADRVRFLYSENIDADENSSRLKVFLVGSLTSDRGQTYELPMSDTLTYLVSSMTKFVDHTPRYVQKILTRDAEANTSVDFTFPRNKYRLDVDNPENKKSLKAVHDLTLALMTDPVYRIDSLTMFATASPEGNWRINGEIAAKRAEAIKRFLERDFSVLYDSLSVKTSIEIDEQGNFVRHDLKETLPDLPRLVRVKVIPEDWNKLVRLIEHDPAFPGDRNRVLNLISEETNPDRRELLIKRRYPTEYAYMREKLYPSMRAVDFRFSLSRKGMKQDTVYTTELDTAYKRGVEYLQKRKYQKALDILRPYEDLNTALAYMSLGYDKAALRILTAQRQNAECRYLQAILQARLGEEQKAVELLLRAADEDSQIKFRANLDPELSVLVKKYGLFREDEDDFTY